MMDLEAEFLEGYFDGRDLESPAPSDNRSEAYRHSWAVGRAERSGAPIPAWMSRLNAAEIEAREGLRAMGVEPGPWSLVGEVAWNG